MADQYIGEIRILPTNFAPDGWFFCDGALYDPNAYPDLFSVIGTTYGGDGTSTFAVPNLNDRVAIGTGQGPGLANYALSQQVGLAAVTLGTSNLPVHSHGLQASGSSAIDQAPASSLFGVGVGVAQYNSGSAATNVGSLSPSGGSQPHDNYMPSLVLKFCIAWSGFFPTSN